MKLLTKFLPKPKKKVIEPEVVIADYDSFADMKRRQEARDRSQEILRHIIPDPFSRPIKDVK